MMVRVVNDFRVGGPYNLLLVEVGQSMARLVWLVDYDRWRDEHGPGAGDSAEVPNAWLVSVVLFEATEDAFDKLVRTDIFAGFFADARWRPRKHWEAPKR